MYKKFLSIGFVFFCLCSCTLNITQTDTHGWAEDVVDTTTEDQVDADLSVPALGL